MNVKQRDVVTLDDDVKYAVVSKITYKDDTYFCFAKQNTLQDFKILKLNQTNGNLEKVDDQNLIQRLLQFFMQDSINILNCTVPDDDDDDF